MKLKSELFDIIKQQDILKVKYQKLEQQKQAKLKELKEKENAIQKGAESKTKKS